MVSWPEIQEWMNANKKLLVMVADPASDSISISFNGLNAFVKFPDGPAQNGIIFNALRASKFKDAIDPMIHGIIKSTGIKDSDKNGAEVLKVIGGAVKGIGEAQKANRDKQLDTFFKDEPKKRVSKTRKKK